jgi:RNA polymerase sigma factor (sigma-70 family)
MKLGAHIDPELLLKGCQKGDRKAQKQLFDYYSSKMYSICYRYLKDAMTAEDAMITGFTKVFEKIGQFKEEGSFEGWIRRIMVNESLTIIRKQRYMFVETDLEEAHPQLDFESIDHQLNAEDLLAMIAELPHGYRVVFNLYAIDGYTHQEIATQLGISENTSKSQLSRARVHLQKKLSSQWPLAQISERP